ncbi:hypothetical protein [Desulfosediminicola flagellatus]|uniref:hypothetical protein n=1 Tax=Desulfosediminicola flagellatus TaxID=2569541 RepID=UPI0010AB7DDA|nr:hypothetical protein [Desulfosediminicola flagellatus]
MSTSSDWSLSPLSWIKTWYNERQLEKKLVEHVVETVDPKIRLASGYRSQLLEPIEVCLQHSESMVASIPGPIYLNPSDYDADPLIHAAFIGSPVSLKELIEKQDSTLISPESAEHEMFALLTMSKRETTVFGPKLQGDVLIQDAQMQSVTFSDHKLVSLATSLESSREQLTHFCFEMILESISSEIAAKRTDIGELHEHLKRLQAMSNIFSGDNHAKTFFGHVTPSDPEKLLKVEKMLKETKDELSQERKGYETPEDWLNCLIELLRHPENMMNVHVKSLRLDWKNVITESSAEKANVITLAQCSLADEGQRNATLICYPKPNKK